MCTKDRNSAGTDEKVMN